MRGRSAKGRSRRRGACRLRGGRRGVGRREAGRRGGREAGRRRKAGRLRLEGRGRTHDLSYQRGSSLAVWGGRKRM